MQIQVQGKAILCNLIGRIPADSLKGHIMNKILILIRLWRYTRAGEDAA